MFDPGLVHQDKYFYNRTKPVSSKKIISTFFLKNSYKILIAYIFEIGFTLFKLYPGNEIFILLLSDHFANLRILSTDTI